ncbi:MAG: hypothetical protein ABIF19_06910 [Planctomycetota bacterium]
MPEVDACYKCNQSFSDSERYVACLIECALIGTVDPAGVERDKIRRILENDPCLCTRLYKRRRTDEKGNFIWEPEIKPVRTVILKLARGHAAYELGLPLLKEPKEISFAPLAVISDEERAAFELPSSSSVKLWPEVASRALKRAVNNSLSEGQYGWFTLQPNRYRYLVDQTKGLDIRMVLSEYLACRVVWGN